MRSPVLAFSIFAATVAPTLVAGAPTPRPYSGNVESAPTLTRREGLSPASLPGLPSLPAAPVRKRATDGGTAGGNAYSGNSNDASGGSVGNVSDSDTAAQGNTAASEFISFVYINYSFI